MMFTGDSQRVVRIIAGLKAEGIVPMVVNWALAKDIRLLALLSQDISSVDFTLKRSDVWSSRVAMFKACLSRHAPRSFPLMLKRCAYLDAVSKGMIDDNYGVKSKCCVYGWQVRHAPHVKVMLRFCYA